MRTMLYREDVCLLLGRLATVNPLLNAFHEYPAGIRAFVFEHEEKSKAKVVAVTLFVISNLPESGKESVWHHGVLSAALGH